jgi:predicted methyltransferase
LKLTLKVNEFRGHHFLEGSPYENTQVKKETVQIGQFVFDFFGAFTGE